MACGHRRGTVMLICIFVSGLVSLMVLGILNSLSVQADTMSAIEQHEQATYVADAGIQHVTSILKFDPKSLGLNPDVFAKPPTVASPSSPVAAVLSNAVLTKAVTQPTLSKPMSGVLKWTNAGTAVSTGTPRGYTVSVNINEKGIATISSDGFVGDVHARRTMVVNDAFGKLGG